MAVSDPDFRHLCAVAEQALARGDRSIAEDMLARYAREADVYAAPGIARPLSDIAHLAQAKGEPVGFDTAGVTSPSRNAIADTARAKVAEVQKLLRKHGQRGAPPSGTDDPAPPHALAHRRYAYDPLDRMVLNSVEREAADAIRRLIGRYEQVLGVRIKQIDGMMVDKSIKNFDILDGLLGADGVAYWQRLVPWSRRNRKRIPGANRRVVDLVFDVLMECRSIRTLERMDGKRNGVYKVAFRRALRDY